MSAFGNNPNGGDCQTRGWKAEWQVGSSYTLPVLVLAEDASFRSPGLRSMQCCSSHVAVRSIFFFQAHRELGHKFCKPFEFGLIEGTQESPF